MTARSAQARTARKSTFLSDSDEELASGGSNIGSSFQNAVENVQQDLEQMDVDGDRNARMKSAKKARLSMSSSSSLTDDTEGGGAERDTSEDETRGNSMTDEEMQEEGKETTDLCSIIIGGLASHQQTINDIAMAERQRSVKRKQPRMLDAD